MEPDLQLRFAVGDVTGSSRIRGISDVENVVQHGRRALGDESAGHPGIFGDEVQAADRRRGRQPRGQAAPLVLEGELRVVLHLRAAALALSNQVFDVRKAGELVALLAARRPCETLRMMACRHSGQIGAKENFRTTLVLDGHALAEGSGGKSAAAMIETKSKLFQRGRIT